MPGTIPNLDFTGGAGGAAGPSQAGSYGSETTNFGSVFITGTDSSGGNTGGGGINTSTFFLIGLAAVAAWFFFIRKK